VAGRFGRDLTAQGNKAMVEFAVEWLSGLFGTEMKRAVGRTQTTQWNKEPWTLGAFSAASPGGADARRVLMEPIRGCVFFAGEALHETAWGSVGGAWDSGVRAADTIMRRIYRQPDPPVAREPETEARSTAPPKRKSR
jgi:monoamine oxidase